MNKKTRKIRCKNKKFKGGSSLFNRMGLSKSTRRIHPSNPSNPLINSKNNSPESAKSSDGNKPFNSQNNGNKQPIQLSNIRVIESGHFVLLSGETVYIIEAGRGLDKRFFEFPYTQNTQIPFNHIESVVINERTVPIYGDVPFRYIFYNVDENKPETRGSGNYSCFIYLAKKMVKINGETFYIKI
uniref:Uncharacterized protein n=1 Tax=viral metagenome TaxID=1070528 RepID=A0A6C0CZT9_9ZZZZ